MAISRNAHIWKGLVDYANESDLSNHPEALKKFAQTLWDSMPWMARTAFGVYGHDVANMIAQQARPDLGATSVPWLVLQTEEQLENNFRRQAVEYQPEVRRLLRWLSDSNLSAQDSSQAFAFLHKHSQHVEFRRGDPAFVPEEEEFRYFDSKGELTDNFPHRTRGYKDLADVVCDFVQTEHEVQCSVPLKICERRGCGNPVAQLKKRRYCRTAACDRERQKRDNDVEQQKNRDSVFVSRLRRVTPAPSRRKKIRESADRLREIQNYWRDKNPTLSVHASKLLDELE